MLENDLRVISLWLFAPNGVSISMFRPPVCMQGDNRVLWTRKVSADRCDASHSVMKDMGGYGRKEDFGESPPSPPRLSARPSALNDNLRRAGYIARSRSTSVDSSD